MARIFISYSRNDEDIARKLATALSDAGANIWIDVADIPAGMNWSTAVQQGLDSCEAMIVIISPEGMDSHNVQDEWQFYLDQGKPVIPVLWRPTEKVHFQLNRLQYVDFHERRFDAAFGHLEEELLRQGISLRDTPTPMPGQPLVDVGGVPLKPVGAGDSSGNGRRLALITVPIVVIVMIVVLVLIGPAEDPGLDETATVAAFIDSLSDTPVPTEPPTETATPTATVTSTDTLTPSGTEYEMTIQSEILLMQTEGAELNAREATSTAVAVRTAFYVTGIAQTATATLWTATPTPNVRETASARLTATQIAEEGNATSTQDALNLTATATLWTPTPTALPGYPGGAGIQSNEDWVPVHETFNDVEMVLVPAGCFMMGYEEGNSDERPVHEQCFDSPFWIDRTEVTRLAYGRCVDADVCPPPPSNEASLGSSQPINAVTWTEALAYCNWRGGRLPTEAEWEYAARGPDSVVYTWGNQFNRTYSANNDNQDTTAAAGLYSAGESWVGALDLLGNMWEWTSSIKTSYPYIQSRAENLSDDESMRVLRGGSYINPVLHAASRAGEEPGLASFVPEVVGFRCAMDYE